MYARVLIVVVALFHFQSAVALRSVDHESYTDPDFVGYRIGKVALVIEESGFEVRAEITKRLSKALKKKGVELVPNKELFPPTRTWTNESRRETYAQRGITSILIVTPGASSSSVVPIILGDVTEGRVTVYGSHATYSESTRQNKTVKAKSRAEFSAVLIDAATDRIAWYCDVLVKAGGTFFVGEKGDAKGAVGFN